VARSPWPVWITGGVDPTTVGPMAAAGARHFVVVRWLTEADDPEDHARRLRRSIDEAVAQTSR
jgi:thiamine monophosphate synthase